MVATDPKVSVIVPAFNSADYTVETVESVLQQTYEDFELLVIDDGSTDNTRDALEPYADRIQYIYKENGGACSARNFGIRLSKGEYVACLDCDDLWLPEKLAHSVAALDANPAAAFVYTGCYLIDSAGQIIDQVRNLCDPDSDVYRSILNNGAIPAPTVVMRRVCLDDVGSFDERIFIPADKDLWLRLARKHPICCVPLQLSKYRLASNYTLKNIGLSLEENLYVLDKQFGDANELPAQVKEQALRQTLYMHAMMYRKIGDIKSARETLWTALSKHGFDWSNAVNYTLSLLGARVWDGVASVRSGLARYRAVWK
jgi:glycosyltransferase involved in cell wall biosynthesis